MKVTPKRSLLAVFAFSLVAAACSGDISAPSTTAPATTAVATSTSTTTSTTVAAEPASNLPWWNDRVFYEIFVRSFKDSDGDGIGDLAGLTASLDYLNDGDPATDDDLGVTGIWLMPIFPSPSYHGYDVTDYRDINPDYGTTEDFKSFLAAAHDRGIAVLIDLVINHSSREHPWFVASAAGDPEYADWYRWSATDPGDVSPWNGGPVWHPLDDRYYFGLFWEGMPDLNLANPDVTAEVYDIAAYWLDMGIDGFRLDGARHLIEDGATMSNTPATVAWLEDFNDYVDSIAPDALVLGEVWSPTAEVAAYIPDALDLAFEFELAESGFGAVAMQDAAILEDAEQAVAAAYPELQYATFLTNHDMNRIMSEVDGDVRIAKLAATWLLTSPGVPFIYYGEEVGLQGVKPDERIRTPMPWNDEAPGIGFTDGTPWEPVDPGFADFNVAAETGDPDSLLAHYRSLIQDRTASLALRRGELIPVTSTSPTVTSFLRSEGDDHVLVVLNLTPDNAVGFALDLASGPLTGMQGVVPVVGPSAAAPLINSAGGFDGYEPLESLPPYGFLVLRFSEETSPAPPVTTTTTTTTLPPASEADVAVVEEFFRAFAAGDGAATSALFSSDAVLIDQSGEAVRLAEVIPPEAGFDSRWDWDEDGIVTVADLARGTNELQALLITSLDVDCAPDGPKVTCTLRQSDVFSDAAGTQPRRTLQTFGVSNGLIVEIGASRSDPLPPDAEALLLALVANYEQWVLDNHPELHPVVFAGECCEGTLQRMMLTVDAIDAQRTLIPDWVASRRPAG